MSDASVPSVSAVSSVNSRSFSVGEVTSVTQLQQQVTDLQKQVALEQQSKDDNTTKILKELPLQLHIQQIQLQIQQLQLQHLQQLEHLHRQQAAQQQENHLAASSVDSGTGLSAEPANSADSSHLPLSPASNAHLSLQV